MLKWILIFFALAVVAAIFGFGGLAGTFAFAAKVLFFVFLALLVISAISHMARAA